MHLWNHVKDISSKGWDAPLLPKPYQWFDKELTAALQVYMYNFYHIYI